MRFDQSGLAACTPTWARPLATSTDTVSRQGEQNLAELHQPPRNGPHRLLVAMADKFNPNFPTVCEQDRFTASRDICIEPRGDGEVWSCMDLAATSNEECIRNPNTQSLRNIASL